MGICSSQKLNLDSHSEDLLVSPNLHPCRPRMPSSPSSSATATRTGTALRPLERPASEAALRVPNFLSPISPIAHLKRRPWSSWRPPAPSSTPAYPTRPSEPPLILWGVSKVEWGFSSPAEYIAAFGARPKVIRTPDKEAQKRRQQAAMEVGSCSFTGPTLSLTYLSHISRSSGSKGPFACCQACQRWNHTLSVASPLQGVCLLCQFPEQICVISFGLLLTLCHADFKAHKTPHI